MNRNILAFGSQGRNLLITVNEYVNLRSRSCWIDSVSVVRRQHMRKMYPALRIVKPSATIRDAAAILERYGSCPDLQTRVVAVLKGLLARKIATPDRGGSSTTTEFVAVFLQATQNPSTVGSNHAIMASDPGLKNSLLVEHGPLDVEETAQARTPFCKAYSFAMGDLYPRASKSEFT
ncbi:hypothetical protein ASPWEDRAFT_169795 [Aspergillus wentii DTO 134E9]|uniref:Uncharacterized protein n=1 Tax=Aspergillus wentii DTO 134E9 TaxID=1073089 RepID=A0A1L9RYE8_ASPWE|nr:uncharacterized protein ASPWEDRAFT_169795 [Aspergillus wentii DTO 134E9]OJJ39971.1 hypothetical protein ASPWEDRAFT_169795 [Aspergillus wentii DTO 134E9]